LLQLLQPLWLFTLTGIAVPVIIHFWNQRPGKTLKVGSTALVIENAKEYRRSVKLSDILLLILRCLLIAALAIGLTSPVWKQPANVSPQKGWILIPRQNIKETYSHFKNTIDSLKNAGLEFHYFEESFPKEKLEDALSNDHDTTNAKNYSYWTLLTLLDEILPPKQPVYLFTDNYLKHFSGNRPALSLSLNWSTFTPSDSVDHQQTAQPDTTSRSIILFTDKYATDARYIKAAIDAVKVYSKKNINCTTITDLKDLPANPDWLFWLSDKELIASSHARNILSYQKGNAETKSSTINMPETYLPSIRLYKSVAADSVTHSLENKWIDGFGNSILTKEKKDSANFYRLYTHFDPGWNELVWSDNFPAIMYNLISDDSITTINANARDNRIIDQQQLLPSSVSNPVKKQNASTFTEINLSGLSWLLVLLLFFTERFASFRNSKLTANG